MVLVLLLECTTLAKSKTACKTSQIHEHGRNGRESNKVSGGLRGHAQMKQLQQAVS